MIGPASLTNKPNVIGGESRYPAAQSGIWFLFAVIYRAPWGHVFSMLFHFVPQ